MKERPILFSTPMVKAILEGRKNQTRRIVKGIALEWLNEGFTNKFVALSENDLCPYGIEGDILWVREEHYRIGHWEEVPGVKTKGGRQKWQFVADSDEVRYFDNPPAEFRKGRHNKDPYTSTWHKRIARFMPKSACRIFLENTGIMVESLHDITEEDSTAEGVEVITEDEKGPLYKNYLDPKEGLIWPADSFDTLWKSINGEESWEANPYVWVIKFKSIEREAQ